MQDPLAVMPLLIPHRCSHAVPIIRVISEKANAKETLIVLQEILERLTRVSEEGEEEESGELSPTLQLERIVFSYAYSKVDLRIPSTSHLIG